MKLRAATTYARARTLADFETHPELEPVWAAAQPGRPALQLVDGSTRNVASIQAVPQEKIRFSSIVGMEELKKSIPLKIIEPFLNPGLFARFKSNAGGACSMARRVAARRCWCVRWPTSATRVSSPSACPTC